MAPVDITLQQKLFDGGSYVLVGLIFLFFGWRAWRVYRRSPNPLSQSFAGFNALVGVGFLISGLITLLTPGSVYYGFDVIISMPFFCLGVSYLSIMVMHIMAPGHSGRLLFWFFGILGFINAILATIQKLGYGNFDLFGYIVSFILAAFVLFAGAIMLRYGTSAEVHRRTMFIGGSLILSGIVGGVSVAVGYSNPTLSIAFDILLVVSNTIGLLGIIRSSGKAR